MKVKRVRGGAWYNGDWYVRCVFRNRKTPGSRNLFVSFRCCFYDKDKQ